MPLKRKATSVNESPTKRLTRSSGPALAESQHSPNKLATAPKLSESSRIKSRAPIRTYGKSNRRPLSLGDSVKENEVDEVQSMCGGNESSEDELNLAPSPTPSKNRRAGAILEVLISPTKKLADNPRLSHPDMSTRASERGKQELISRLSSPENSISTESESSRGTSVPSIHFVQETAPTRHSPKRIAIDVTAGTPLPVTPVRRQQKHARTRKESVSISKSKDNLNTPRVPTLRGIAYCAEEERRQNVGGNVAFATPPSSANHSRRSHARDTDTNGDSPSHSGSPRKRRKVYELTPPSPVPQSRLNTAKSSSPTNLDGTLEYSSSPSHSLRVIPMSPSRRSTLQKPRKPDGLPPNLQLCLNLQKRVMLQALHHPLDQLRNTEKDDGDNEAETNEIAREQLTNILTGSVVRNEGNSCLILGPRGSGKTKLVEWCISNLSEKPIVLRLSGWTEHSDRLAMREIAYQLGQQTGSSFLIHPDDALEDREADDEDIEEPNPFIDKPPFPGPPGSTTVPSSAHLPALISVLPTLDRPTVVVLDGFDLFALHPRQSLLYCLLDTSQSCRASPASKGIAVVGITSRLDTINLLEKRVKSRFSGRILRSGHPRELENWLETSRLVLHASINSSTEEGSHEGWKSIWDRSVDNFLDDKATIKILNETFSITRDIRMLSRILGSAILQLTPSSPFLSSSDLKSAALSQQGRPRFPFLHTLSYPALCLLIASVHADTAGHLNFTFEMLHEYFRDQVRVSSSAPVQVNGGSIGMVRCSRSVLMSAFEHMVSIRVFVGITSVSPVIAKEFVKHRSVVDREIVKKAIENTGNINLRKWLTKAQ